MALILRVKANWTGFAGAPGYTVLHFRDFGTGEGGGTEVDATQAQQATTKVRTWFNSMAAFFPDDVTITMDPVVDAIEDTTGVLQDSFGVTPGALVKGTSTTSYAAPIGAVVNWRTSSIRNGRRIRGRSFLVPLISSAFDTTGRLSAASVNDLAAAAATLADSGTTPDLGVYARPSAPGAADGQWAVVTSSNVPALGAVLTSRRD